MISTIEKLTELKLWYTLQELATFLNVSVSCISKASIAISNNLDSAINSFFEQHCLKNSQQVKVSDLQKNSNNLQVMMVSTPDGFQPILQIFNKKSRPIYKLTVGEISLRCSNDHLIQTIDGWVLAKDLTIGQAILTKTGYQQLVSKELQPTEPVYDFEVGHDNHRYWSKSISSHNSGKSYLMCNFIKQAQQEQNAFVLALDSENALDDEFVEKIGVDTSPENYLYISLITMPHLKKIISDFVKAYKASGETRPVIIAIDSLAMLLTDNEFEQLTKGEQKGDQGQRSKQIKAIMKGFVQLIKKLNIQMIVTDQVYVANQEAKLNGTSDGNWVVNSALRYSLSNLLLITRLKLKDGVAENTGDVIGVRMKCEGIKTRFAKPFQKVSIEVPYETGMNKYSGFKEACLEYGILIKKGAYYKIVSTDDQFYWKDVNEERYNVLLNDAELKSNVSLGASLADDEELIDTNEESIAKKRIENFKKFKEQNPDYVFEPSDDDID